MWLKCKCLNVLFLFFLDKGVSVYWLGDFVFVESGLGVRVKFDLTNTVYVTVTAEHKSGTRGLCGVYNGNADGEKCADTRYIAWSFVLQLQMLHKFHKILEFCFHICITHFCQNLQRIR